MHAEAEGMPGPSGAEAGGLVEGRAKALSGPESDWLAP